MDKYQDYSKQVDALGAIRESIKEMQTKEKELTELLRENLPVGVACVANEYTATITVATNSELNPEKIKKIMGAKEFMQVVSVKKTDAQRFLTGEQLDACTVVTGETKRLAVTRRR